ncbi:hypothetical protein PFICI_04700 [Pestalotiopsis fici W106-1]|uniref:Heterokaryon incompatibility domain-containing protein n=1 Tax=Pestalotiopsis fici (strain W106-1 / CGMCC3.15140) TaxID=1229662 RepID=W3X9X5_PESFW|nr:uncharacterized protein PFICI_04700 [Pestalotiopsis fici W106-1]ETS82824.1 hypothetical protein PFICI_04700 [Pestalotiopsis fici W106-1]
MEMSDNGLLSTGPKVYIHKPLLLSASIRILELLPSRDRDSPIHCKIREFALTENRHSYDALSYVWGPPTDVRPVVLDDAILHVTVNCWSALRHLRHKYYKRMLWVDAICIDQRNTSDAIQERSKQIKLMGKVYQWAKRVIIWLGPGNDATWATLATAQALSFLSGKRSSEATANVETGTLSNKYYAELIDMMQNPWFVRVWTIQEMALARRRVVRRGDSEWSWLSFQMMQHGIMTSIGLQNWEVLERSELTQLMFTILPSRWLTFRMKWYHKVFDRSGPSRIGRELNKGLELKVLSSLMVHKATEAIDKVYSVYRILELMYIKIPEPDYNKSALEAYKETTRCWIRSRQDLAILLIAARPTSHGEGPSWVPDWGQDVPPNRARWLDSMATKPLLDNLASKRHYQASKQSRAYLQKGNSIEIPGQLPVSGKLLGKVSIGVTTKNFSRDLSPALFDAASLSELSKDWVEAFCIWSVMVSQLTSYPNGETPIEAFYECIIG